MRPDRAKVTQGVGFALPWAAILLGFQPVLVFPNRRDVALRRLENTLVGKRETRQWHVSTVGRGFEPIALNAHQLRQII